MLLSISSSSPLPSPNPIFITRLASSFDNSLQLQYYDLPKSHPLPPSSPLQLLISLISIYLPFPGILTSHQTLPSDRNTAPMRALSLSPLSPRYRLSLPSRDRGALYRVSKVTACNCSRGMSTDLHSHPSLAELWGREDFLTF